MLPGCESPVNALVKLQLQSCGQSRGGSITTAAATTWRMSDVQLFGVRRTVIAHIGLGIQPDGVDHTACRLRKGRADSPNENGRGFASSVAARS